MKSLCGLSGLFKDVVEQVLAELAAVLHEVHQIVDDLRVTLVEGRETNSATFRVLPDNGRGHSAAAFANDEFNNDFVGRCELNRLSFQKGAGQADVF